MAGEFLLNRILSNHNLDCSTSEPRSSGSQQHTSSIRRKTQAIHLAVGNRQAPDKLVVFDPSLFNQFESSRQVRLAVI